MSHRPDRALLAIDGSLLRIRRLWTSSVFTDKLRAAMPDDVELSAVFVAEAVGRGPGETTVGKLAELLGVEASTASRLAASTQEAGFIDRKPSEMDNRRTVLTLTPSGEELVERALDFRLELLRDLTSGWTGADRTRFGDLMTRFSQAVMEARVETPS